VSPAAEEVAREREAQHLPPKVMSERALLAIARLVNESTQQEARPA
jgi:hypothetical protein